ncbi:MAG: hypothetical protein PGN07_10285 [Aeromicrobium erythreum]
MNRSLVRTAATTAVLLLLTLLSVPAHAASPSLSATRVVAGEKLVLKTRVGGPARRPITLQRWSGKRWTTVLRTRTASRGTTALVTRQPARTTSYRAVAARTGKHRAVTTRSVRAVALAQRLDVSMPMLTTTRQSMPVQATFSPVRAGRAWTIETSSLGAPWRPAASGRLDGRGRLATTIVTPSHADPVTVRVTVLAAAGAGAVSATRVVEVMAKAPEPQGPPTVASVSDADQVAETSHRGVPSTSSDGRYVAFASASTVLAGADGNGATQIFVRDTKTGTTRLVSRTDRGEVGDESSTSPVISADGHKVVFESRARNLGPGDIDDSRDVFLADLESGRVLQVSLSRSSGGTGDSYSPDLSANGRYITFVTDDRTISGSTNVASQVVVLDRRDGTVRTASRSAGGSYANWPAAVPQVADNGRTVFASQASNLSDGDTNGVSDLFLWDPETEVVTNATGHATTGTFGKAGSFDINPVGDFVAVSTAARLVPEDTDDLPDVYRWEVAPGRDGLRLVDSDRSAYSPRMSDDGRRIVFETGERVSGTVHWSARIVEMGSMAQGPVTVRANGHESDADTVGPVLSGDGRVVAFATSDDDLAGRALRGVSQVLVQRLGD